MSSLSPRDMSNTNAFLKNLCNVLVQSNKQTCMHGGMVYLSGYVQSTPDVTKTE